MQRLTPAFLALAVLGATLAGLSLAAHLSRPVPEAFARAADPAIEQAVQLDLFMSDSPNGSPQRNFMTSTHQVHAVVRYSDAPGLRYRLRARDLSGIVVKTKDLAVFNGAGQVSEPISAADFVAAYSAGMADQSALLREDIPKHQSQCNPSNIPPVPPVWPPQDPRDPFATWLKDTNALVESTRSTTAEMTRTLQAFLTMPEVGTVPALQTALEGARVDLAMADQKLKQVPSVMQPEGQRPNPQAGCALITEAMGHLGQGLDDADQASASVPQDVSGWHLPPTSARYDMGVFVSCIQYEVDLLEIKNNRPADNATAMTQWTLGTPGEAALVFPKPNLVDAASSGMLNVSYTDGAEAMYAQTVTVPGVNRGARVSAFVTDAMCIPVDGIEMTFAVDPTTAGSLSQTAVQVSDGVAETDLSSGNIAARGKVNGVACVGDCDAGGSKITGSAGFDVIGPVDQLEIKVSPPNTLNPHATRPDQRRAQISVFAWDALTRRVANGTPLSLRIDPGPGVLAYERERVINGRPSGQKEIITLGKRADLVIDRGVSRMPPADPGYLYGNLFLAAGDDGEGPLTLVAEAEGTVESIPYEIASRLLIYLPSTAKRHDIRATATRRTPLPTDVP